eukprot:TRINITY_DN2830_c0_g1_i1.p1 TRINITY_DN2830_c0_g1~~TRINITY_DN2830_c0_g1_i1.p1  ORF type:complete len:128 (-),score=33.68 TRINITY_DN2830_c0_g1_i1:63-446(-)
MMEIKEQEEREPEEDFTGVAFKDPMWLAAFPLNQYTALDYFALSQFYDHKCNNEIIKMQRLDLSLLKTLKGVEYTIIHARDPILFVVRKQFRRSQEDVVPKATYYILNGTIYQSPNLFNIFNARLVF